MVNFSSKTPDSKPLLTPPILSKSIRKPSKTKILSPSPKYRSPLTLLHSSDLSSSSFYSEASSSQPSIPNSLQNILQPFCNYGLFPSSLQGIVSGSSKLEQNEIRSRIYQLRTPENQMSYQKKLEKMKLLALGQETILQNYIKDKYAGSQEPDLLKDYYRYMKAKITLVKDLQEMRGKNVLSFFGENEEKNLRNQAGVNPHSLLYDQYCEIKEEDCFSELQMFREDEKDDYEEKKSENMHNQQFFCGKNMLFYDEDRFLAKEEDFKQRS